MFRVLSNAVRFASGLYPTAVDGDYWHSQTPQLNTADNAELWAYDRLSLPMHGPLSYGMLPFGVWQDREPLSWTHQRGPRQGLGGVFQGTALTQQLLLSQADALARGLYKPGGFPGVMGT